MLKIFLFIAFFCLSDIVRSQTVCDCEDVWVVPVDINQLAEADILYSQVSSTATQRLLIDNVCYSQELNDDGVLNVGMSITYQNGSVVTANVEQSQIEPGIFLISGGADYIDYIIGEPCDSVYVIYRCFYKRRRK
ncbi:uncharacterized protein LOC128999067 [Macrosteles quadrilineatus]|uniref:uncharacterized protein LOC128999067 n=1 Tax=Macrosteles quadrilineatus TaxID=74068 RepID=UPI0023E337BE|nr:uncharacterized protein LOC128999067 [Macrosteles quadrilineatus]